MTTDERNRKTVYAQLAGREKHVRTSAEGIAALLEKLGGNELTRLIGLWKNWDAIMGEDLSALGVPLGHKENTLLIGAGDSMALQELSLQSPLILEQANQAMGSEFFTEVKVFLQQGSQGLARGETGQAASRPARVSASATGPAAPPVPAPCEEQLPEIGGLLGILSPDSPVARCYEAVVRADREAKKK